MLNTYSVVAFSGRTSEILDAILRGRREKLVPLRAPQRLQRSAMECQFKIVYFSKMGNSQPQDSERPDAPPLPSGPQLTGPSLAYVSGKFLSHVIILLRHQISLRRFGLTEIFSVWASYLGTSAIGFRANVSVNIIACGGTAVGKTTFLQNMQRQIDDYDAKNRRYSYYEAGQAGFTSGDAIENLSRLDAASAAVLLFILVDSARESSIYEVEDAIEAVGNSLHQIPVLRVWLIANKWDAPTKFPLERLSATMSSNRVLRTAVVQKASVTNFHDPIFRIAFDDIRAIKYSGTPQARAEKLQRDQDDILDELTLSVQKLKEISASIDQELNSHSSSLLEMH